MHKLGYFTVNAGYTAPGPVVHTFEETWDISLGVEDLSAEYFPNVRLHAP